MPGKIREALKAYQDAAQYDATMEGPRFKGWNRSQLDRARKLAEATLSTLPKDDSAVTEGQTPEHASDCAVHSEPAYPAGPCNCGALPHQSNDPQTAWQDISTAPKDGEFLAEDQYGDWIRVQRFDHMRFGAERVINPRTGRHWPAKRWMPLPPIAKSSDGGDAQRECRWPHCGCDPLHCSSNRRPSPHTGQE